VTQSMTGFARGSVTTGTHTVTVECRSVNNRFLDVQFRMPEALRECETLLREQVGKAFSRGKLELTIRTQDKANSTVATIDHERLSALKSALTEIGESFPKSNTPDQLSIMLAPGVLAEHPADLEALQSATSEALAACLSELREQRLSEGKKIGAYGWGALYCYPHTARGAKSAVTRIADSAPRKAVEPVGDFGYRSRLEEA